MSKRDKSRIKGNNPSGRRKRVATVFILVAAVLLVAGIVGVKLSKASRPAGGRSPVIADADNDRELRHEQLEVAQKLLTDFSTNDDAVYLAGLVHEDQGNMDEAMKLWARSIELDATRGDANESLGQALLLRDDYAAAEKYLRRALEIDTNSVNARFRLAKTLSQQGKLQDALV